MEKTVIVLCGHCGQFLAVNQRRYKWRKSWGHYVFYHDSCYRLVNKKNKEIRKEKVC